MPVDPEKALGAELPPVTGSWAPDDVILYHLGVGAGDPPTDPRELAYTYEGGLKVLPTFGVIAAAPALAGMLEIPGLEINWATLLHGEQDLTIHRPLPTSADVVTSGRVAGLYDKGKAALLVLDVDTREEGGEALFTNRYSLFLRGEGGFGGEPGPQPGNDAPERPADFTVVSPTLPQQALLYRLSGDKNP
ncbi:MAG TPA: MaoC family dehydratase N-terminal domain-containing protein, partial [Egibacteraceae bacterium]|nr:MaoC family dehydratase N-terminal domain-containing protein [Egibacteraceae bacterium]